ncbi:MAG: MFS transporter [Chloroflexi bacterium]|nr:MFS transporter [Chloroflexota bacterium]
MFSSKKLVKPWLLIAGAMIVGFIVAERATYGVFLGPIQDAFHLTRSQATLPLSLTLFTMGITQPLAGVFIDRFGGRKSILLGVIFLILGLSLASRAQNLWQLILSYGLFIGFAGATISGNAWAILIGSWFKKERRATILGMNYAAWRISPMFFGPLAAYLITKVEWNGTFLIFAIITAAIALPVAFLFVQEAPGTVAASATLTTEREAAFLSPEVRRALKTRVYWILLATWLGCGFEVAILSAHLPSLGLQYGLSRQVGAVALGVFGVSGAVGAITGGWASDHFGRYRVLVFGFVVRAIGVYLLAFAVSNTTTYYIMAAIAGFPSLFTSPIIQLLLFEIFGKKIAGRVIGLSFLGHQLIGTISPYLAGWLFDLTGSYAAPFTLAATALLVSAILATRLEGIVKHHLAGQTTPASSATTP